MKKIQIAIFIFFYSVQLYSSNYHVARNMEGAADSNPGDKNSPFMTIQKAASVAEAGDTVFVHEGIYRETIVPLNSGKMNSPVVYMPYGTDRVTISGTEVKEGWEKHEGYIYKALVQADFFISEVNQTDQVFVDGKMMNLARWPNTGLDPSYPEKAETNEFVSKEKKGNITTGVMIDDDLPEGDYIGAEMYMQPNNGAWSWTFTGKVTDVKGTQFTFESFSSSGQDFKQDVYHPKSRYYLYNKMTLLDTAGEWYHDKSENMLYLWLPDDENPIDHLIEVKKRDYGFNLSTKSYIEIYDFHFFACNITTDDVSGGDGKGFTEDGDVRYPWRGKGSVAESHHILIDGINCLYPSHSTDVMGHFFFQYGGHSGIVLSGNNHILRNSIIRYSFANGISLLGNNHKIHNNLIEDVNYSACGYGALGSSASKAYDCEVSYNTIRRTGRSGIRLGIRNSDPSKVIARLHHNEISDFMLQDHDGGGIYTGGDGKFLRIDHNMIHDGKGYIVSGIYPDWGINYIFDHNIVYNMWANFQFTHSHNKEGINNFIVYNNTAVCTNNAGFVHGPFNFVCSGGKQGTILKNNIGTVFTPPFAGKYKAWSDGNTFDDIERSHNLFEINPEFVSFPSNFQLKSTSPAIDKGEPMDTVIIDGVKIPPFNDPVVGQMDIGAYEYGMKPFSVGSTLDTLKKSSIEIFIAGATGIESVTLMINDNPVAVFDSIGGNITNNEFERYTHTVNKNVSPDKIKIWLNNVEDAGKEVRIDKIIIHGKEMQTEDMFNSCTPDNSEYLSCSGYVQFREKIKYTLDVDAKNGYVELAPPGGIYNEGTQITITAVADDGYKFTGWSGDASGSSNPKNININRNKKITALFTDASKTENRHEEESLIIYPNPVNNTVNIKFGSCWNNEVMITIHNLHGKTLFQENVFTKYGEVSLNLSHLTMSHPGIHSIRISDNEQTKIFKLAIR